MDRPGSTVLVITGWFDPTADMVIDHLSQRGVPVFRVDPGDLPARLTISGELGDGGFTTTVWPPDRSLNLADVACAWYRRPTAFRFDGLGEAERRWATGEARAGLGGLIALVPTWLNHPAAIGRAEYKPLQLATARRVGLQVPRTLITNDPRRAASFTARLGGVVIYKSLASPLLTDPGGVSRIIYTTPVGTAAAGSAGVATTPHLFQQRITKDYELRITYIDGDCHTARIDTASRAASVDWRADHDHATFTRAELPDGVAGRIRRLMYELGLRYGALDMIVDPDGEHWLLEVNPNGQFGFVEHATGMPLSAAIATALTSAATPSTEE
jgi:ATP-grasp ribosomal peptide maturase